MPIQKIYEFVFSHAWVLGLLIIWTLIWKGLALWKSARGKQYVWFILLLALNTLGILEIIYILVFAPKPEPQSLDDVLNQKSNKKKII